jgi:hypothetical protein
MRLTSLEAYREIKERKLLSAKRFEVYECLYQNGPLTAHEIVAIGRKANPLANQTSWNARLSELEALGVVRTVGEKLNPVSNVSNLLWDVTDKIPSKFVKPESAAQKVKRLEAEVIRLTAVLYEIKCYGCIPDSLIAKKALEKKE